MPDWNDASQQAFEQDIPPSYQLASASDRALQENAFEFQSSSVPKHCISTFSALDGAVWFVVRPVQSQDEPDTRPMQACSPDQVVPLDAPSCQLSSSEALQGSGGPDCDHSSLSMETNPQERDLQLNTSDFQLTSVPKDCLSAYSTLDGAVELYVAHAQPQNHSSPCPICEEVLGRVAERNRHLESHLPHSILCPSSTCPWTGRRQYDFKQHWKTKHVGNAPEEGGTKLYDAKDFVKSIIDGTPVEEVARSAFETVQEGLGIAEKPNLMVNVLGRNRDLKEWIIIPLSELN